MTRGSLSKLWLAAPLALALHAAPASAGSSEVTPFIGAMIPANTLLMETTAGTLIRMQTQTLYGFDMGKMISSRFGLSAVLAAGTGKFEVISGSQTLDLATTTFIADLRGRIRLCGNPDEANTGLVLGGGYTDVNSALFDYAHETHTGTFLGRLTGIVGGDVHAPVSDRFGLKVTAVDRIHLSGVSINGVGGTGIVEKTQNDICVTAGLTFKLNH